MSQLSDYHLRRPRLTSRVLGARTSVIVGGAGYGKSALAAEAAEFLDVPVIATALESAGVSAALLPHRLRSAAARVGLSDLAALMDRAAPAGAGVLDAMLEALAGSGALIVVDEVQNAEPEALALLTRLSGQLGADQRLLLIGREAPVGFASLRRDSAAGWLGTADLAMTTAEVAALCRQGFGLTVAAASAERLTAATGGWTAAVVLAASQARSADQPLLADSGRDASGTQVLAGLVEQILRGMPEGARSAVVQLAHLPLLRDRIAARATGLADLLAVVSQAGLPLKESSDGWFEFIGPVQHLLAARAPVSASVLTAAAAAYAQEGRTDLAVGLLIGAGRAGDGAALLVAMSPVEAERLGLDELGGLPLIVERQAATSLLGLVAATGHPLAIGLATMTFPVTVSVLGGFAITRGGRAVDVPPGQGRQLVKLVATAGGRLTTDAAMEALWPQADPDASANRLRTVLNRLKDAAGDVVVRDNRQLCFAPEVHTDVRAFTDDARRATLLAASGSREAVSAARAALGRYRGDLLPDDPYEAWAELPRQRLRSQALGLLDLCADWAARADDLDEAVRCLERAIDLAPDEEERYLNAARRLLTQGRRGAARSMVQRARSVVESLGVQPSVSLIQLENQLRRRALAV